MDLRRKVLNLSNVSRNYETANEDSCNSLYLSCYEDNNELENTLEQQSPAKNNKICSATPLKERTLNIQEIITTSTPMKDNIKQVSLSFEDFGEDQAESDSNNDITVKALNDVSDIAEVLPPVSQPIIPEIVIEPPEEEEKFENDKTVELPKKEDEKALETEVIDTVAVTKPVDEPLNPIILETPAETPIKTIPNSEKERHITTRMTLIPQKTTSTTKKLTIAAPEKKVAPALMPLRSMMPKIKEIVGILADKPKLPTVRKSVFAVRFQSKTSLHSPVGLNDSFRRRGNLRRTLVPVIAENAVQKTGDKRRTLFQADKRKTLIPNFKKVEEKKPVVVPAEPKKSAKRRSSSPVAATEILKKPKPESVKVRVGGTSAMAKPSTIKFGRNQCKYCDKSFSLQQALDNHYVNYCLKIPAGARKKIMVENYKKEKETFTGLSEKRRTIFALPTAPLTVNASLRSSRTSSTPKAHSGVMRTPRKVLKCTTCKKEFLDVLDFANDMQKHKQEKEQREAAEKAKINV